MTGSMRKSFATRGAISSLILIIMLPVLVLAQQQRRGGNRQGGAPPAARAARAPTSVPAPIVIITKKDGAGVRGQIISADPDDVEFQPSLRANEREMPEPIAIKWSEITRISNGLTRQKVLDEWKQQHVKELCETCHGDRIVLCATCKGTGHDPASGADCKTCKGELLVDCKDAKCDAGKITCANGCLKLSEGTWFKKPDGLMWRRFPVGNGYFEVSERHLGQLVVRQGAQWTLGATCPVCGGTTKVECTACHGQGKISCPTCIARKDAPPCPQHCEIGYATCATCNGSGLKPAAGVPTQASPR